MKNLLVGTCHFALCAAAMAQSAIAQDTAASGNVIQLAPITLHAPIVIGGSSEDGDTIREEYGGNVDRTLRDMPGVYTRTMRALPSKVINIRGMQSRGRVASMIEGVPQTFRNISGHSGTLETMVFVDEQMISGLDVVKGSVPGAAGVGTLSGSANFRMLDFDDVILAGHNTGAAIRIKAGTNSENIGGLLSFGKRFTFSNGAEAAFMVAYSGSNEIPYADGNGNHPWDYRYAAPEKSFTESEKRTGLIRLELRPSDVHRFTLTAINHESNFQDFQNGYPWDVGNDTYKLEYNYTPENPLIDLSISLAFNETDVKFDSSKRLPNGGSFYLNRHHVNSGRLLTISNWSFLSIGGGDLSLNYGLTYRSDDYHSDNKRTIGANGIGELATGGIFVDAKYATGAWEIDGGLKLMGYELDGVSERTVCGAGQFCDKRTQRSGGSISGRLRGTYHIDESTFVYADYSHTTRPPTVAEMFMPSFHNFGGTIEPVFGNLDLKTETSRTLEIGAHREFGNASNNGSSFVLEASAFRSSISNFIGYGIASNGVDPRTNPDPMNVFRWANAESPVTMYGLELSARYDSSTWFGGVSANLSETDQPVSAGVGIVGDDNSIPGRIITLDLGRKFMDGQLRFGGRYSHNGDIVKSVYNQDASGGYHAATRKSDDYGILDLYATYEVSETATAYLTIENVADEYYDPANVGTPLSKNLGGPGRTISLGVNMRF